MCGPLEVRTGLQGGPRRVLLHPATDFDPSLNKQENISARLTHINMFVKRFHHAKPGNSSQTRHNTTKYCFDSRFSSLDLNPRYFDNLDIRHSPCSSSKIISHHLHFLLTLHLYVFPHCLVILLLRLGFPLAINFGTTYGI